MLDEALLFKWMAAFDHQIQTDKAYLSGLDAEIGDGDHGDNMARGMSAVMHTFKTPDQSVAEQLKAIAFALISKVGGAAGPLYGSAFLRMSKAATDTQQLDQLIQIGADAIADRGGANFGDKTMLDVWAYVPAMLEHHTLSSAGLAQLAANTKPMQAKKGRASYLGERSVGHLDPGAVSSQELFQALLLAQADLKTSPNPAMKNGTDL
ncbi:MAG: dihydroxyacetone kinase subunit L [Lactobacillus sp.]|jgi:dihydroxyacetone kinase-like protein|nr:dihydroxyacetone kinase subunit L [Lactobacillus sp.]